MMLKVFLIGWNLSFSQKSMLQRNMKCYVKAGRQVYICDGVQELRDLVYWSAISKKSEGDLHEAQPGSEEEK